MDKLTNKKYGSLTIIDYEGQTKSKQTYWKCLCDCGKITNVQERNLITGNTKSCGCKQHEAENLTGQKFGKLTAIKRARNIKRNTAWTCLCDCGKTIEIRSGSLKNRNTKSCGCNMRVDLTGQTHKNYKVIKATDKRDKGNIIWKCKNLKTGKIEEVSKRKLTRLKQGELTRDTLINPPATL